MSSNGHATIMFNLECTSHKSLCVNNEFYYQTFKGAFVGPLLGFSAIRRATINQDQQIVSGFIYLDYLLTP